jgi:hypothetical protein
MYPSNVLKNGNSLSIEKVHIGVIKSQTAIWVPFLFSGTPDLIKNIIIKKKNKINNLLTL